MILALLLQAAAAAAPDAPTASAAPPNAPPNVVLIISDDQAWTDFGFMGSDTIRTPRLDQLARESLVFTSGYVPTSLCRPSLATMITGLYPHQHQITGNDPPKGVDRGRMLAHIGDVETLPKILGRAGYASLQTGKWWEGNWALGGFTAGMTHGDPARGGRHGDEGLAIGRETMAPILDFLDEQAASETPFFLWYAPFLPHRPHDPPARLLAKYETEGRPPSVAKYDAMCEWFDETCGTLLDALDERGLAENTLVLFVVDNGWIQDPSGPGYAVRSKRTPYEGGVRTPILVRWPGHVAPGRRDEPVSTIDLAPTVLEACGLPVPASLPGTSLLGAGREGAPARGPVFGASFTHDEVDVNDPARSLLARWVVDGRWKLVRTRTPEERVELFDLAEDPGEERDLSAAQPERVAALSAAIDGWWPAAAPARPNILFLLTDDQRADAMGCAGHPFLATPSMDGLAARGVRFTNAFVTTSICAASRASFLTSLHERAHGYTFGKPPIAAEIARDSYPSLLRAAGYRTGFVGKWGVKVEKDAQREMFDVFRPLSPNPYLKERADGTLRHLTDITADEAIEFLEGCSKERPFCLSISFNAPHAEDGDPRQYIWPPALDGLYDNEAIPPPPLSEPAFFSSQPEFLRESLGRTRWGWRFDTEGKRVAMTRGYYRMITGVDNAIARILVELEKLQLADDTVVVFTSDNGYFLGERGFAGKWLIYEDSVRVPLIVFDPRAPAERRGTTEDAMALNVDVAPTILTIAGVPVPATWQGESLVPLLRGEDPPWREDFFYEHLFDHPAIPKSRGVRGARWVYVQYFEQDPVHEELYDLAADPHEAHDLAHDPASAAVLAKMRARCDTLAAARTRVAWGPPPDEGRFELATLASGLDKPLELAVAPDGRVFFIEHGGRLAVYRPDVGAVIEAARFDVFTDMENGLIGLALDPDFADNGWLYLMRSPRHYPGQWISRFTVVGDVLDRASEKLVFAFEEQRQECCHHAGSLEFGPGGDLFIATGDNTNPFGSDGYAPIDERDGKSPWDGQKGPANTYSYSGKVLRIHPTDNGGYVIPDGNLFTDRAAGRPEIYAMGCRNPWRISVDAETGVLYWGDVGPDASVDSDRGSRGFDEINQAKRPGFFGWPYFIADNRPYADYDFAAEALGPRFDPAQPVNDSPNNTGRRDLPPAQPAWVYYPYEASAEFPSLDAPGGRTACAGPVYHFDPALDSKTKFPAYYDDCLFAYEWSRHWVKTFRLGADSELLEMRPFLAGVKLLRPVDLQFGPEGSLYMLEYGTTWDTNDDSRLVRIDYFPGNRPPVARASATGNVGRDPLAVELTAAGTFDKDEGDRLAYEWRVVPGDAVLSRDPEATLVFDEPGVFTVELAVTDAVGARSTANVPVLVGNDPPELRFVEPRDGAFFDPDHPISWSVEVFDTEDGDTDSNPFDLAPHVVMSATLDAAGPFGDADGAEGERDAPGLARMKRSDCFNCHTFDHKIVGPALYEIAERYRDDGAAIETAAGRVIAGSSGVWSEVPMLPHAQHTLEETREMVRWITSLEPRSAAQAIQVGVGGKVDARELCEESESAMLVLAATYTDAGGGPVGPLAASDRVVLRSRAVEAEHYTSRVGTQTLSSGTASAGRFIGAIDHENFLRFAAVDLADVGSVTLSVSSAGGGGTIELRAGELDGPLLASTEVVPNGAWEEWYELSLPIAYSGPPCDLYVRFLNPERPGGLMNLDRMTFRPLDAGEAVPHEPEDTSQTAHK